MSFQKFCKERLVEKSTNLPPIDMKLIEVMLSIWIKRHLESEKHRTNISYNSNKRKSNENLSVIGSSAKAKSKDFGIRKNSAFMSADIPLEKFNNENFRAFLNVANDFYFPIGSASGLKREENT